MSLHRPTFVDLVAKHGWTRGAELGVDKGILTRMLLVGVPSLHLIAVDTFPDRHRSRRVFEDLECRYADRLTVRVSTTHAASDRVEDGSLDFVFIDADHSYASVADDIACWRSKVRPSGWLGGHDYHPRKFPGVVKAVRRAFGDRVQLWPGTIWGIWC